MIRNMHLDHIGNMCLLVTLDLIDDLKTQAALDSMNKANPLDLRDQMDIKHGENDKAVCHAKR